MLAELISKSITSDARTAPIKLSSVAVALAAVPPPCTTKSPVRLTTALFLTPALTVVLTWLVTNEPMSWPAEVASLLVCTPATAPTPTTFCEDKASTDKSWACVSAPPDTCACVLPLALTIETAAPTPAEPLPVLTDKAPPPAPMRLRS